MKKKHRGITGKMHGLLAFLGSTLLREDVETLTEVVKKHAQTSVSEPMAIAAQRTVVLEQMSALQLLQKKPGALARFAGVLQALLLEYEQTCHRLSDELAEANKAAPAVARFNTHLHLMNESPFALDFFEYDPDNDLMFFANGHSAIPGYPSRVPSHIRGFDFFETFQCTLCQETFLPDSTSVEGSHRRFRSEMRECLCQNKVFTAYFYMPVKEEGIIWFRCWGKSDNAAGKVYGVFQSINPEVKRWEDQRNDSMHDSLSGFYNREALQEIGNRLLRERTEKELLTFFVFNLSEAEHVKNHFGLGGLAAYIQAYATLANGRMNDRQVVFRMLGTEFLCILRGFTDEAAIQASGEAMVRVLSQTQHIIDGMSVSFPIYAGYAIAGIHGDTLDELLDNAAYAIHKAEMAGVGTVMKFSAAACANDKEQLLKLSFLDGIILRNDMRTVFQPVVDVQTAQIIGFEALTRPGGNIYASVSELLTATRIARKTDAMEMRMVYNAMDRFSSRPELFQKATLFLNCSSVGLLSESTCRDLQQRYVKNMHIVVEMHGTKDLSVAEVQHFYRSLQQVGVGFAIDQFGMEGMDTLSLLLIKPTYIKLDPALVLQVCTDACVYEKVAMLVSCAKQAQTRVVAVGIETHEALQTVISLGVDCVQGFYLGPPADDFAPLHADVRAEMLSILAEKKSL